MADSSGTQNKSVVMTFVTGLILSVFLYATMHNWEQQQLEAKLTETTEEYHRAFANTLNQFIHELEIIKIFYLSSDNVSLNDFVSFTEKLANDPAVQAVAWVPKIRFDEKVRHEENIKHQLNLDYAIKGKMLNNKYLDNSKHKYYYPVAYISPLQRNKHMLGYDIRANARRLAAIKTACDTGQPTATAVFQLDETDDTKFIMIFYPVYSKNNKTPLANKKAEHPQSFITGIFNIKNLLEKALGSLNSKGLNIYFTDITKNADRLSLFYKHVSRSYKNEANNTGSNWLHKKLIDIFLKKIQKTKSLNFAGREWQVKYEPIGKFYADHYQWYAAFVFVLGTSFTLLTVFLIRVHYQKNQQQLEINRIKGEQLNKIKIAQDTMLDTMAGGVIVINAKGIIESFNKSAEKIFGYSAEEIIGKTVNVLMPQDIAKHHNAYLQNVIEKGVKTSAIESKFKGMGLRKDGSVFPIALSIKSMTIDGEIKFTGILRDITQQVESEKQIIYAKEKAELANRSKSEFLSNMSHELRTPMHAILSFSKFGLDKYTSVERDKLKSYFEKINLSGTRLLKLLNSLLDLAKLEEGNVELELDYADINSLVVSVIHEFEALAGECEVDVKESLLAGEKLVECDQDKIGQVIRNLLGNALKFTPKGKGIEVQLKECRMQKNQSEETVDAIQIKISDEGIGIPEDELKLVFDKFAQSSKTNDGSGGTGLGLAICAEIIDKHHGKIWAENNSEVGATFTVEIPLTQN